MWPVKRKRALVETNPPRNNRLKLIKADEHRGRDNSAPDVLQPNIGLIDFPCLKKLLFVAPGRQDGTMSRGPGSSGGRVGHSLVFISGLLYAL